jgi:hypothetical protein
MGEEVLTVTMTLPKSVLERFKSVARQIFPEEKEEAASLLLSIFVEYMSRPDEYWCLFIPDLPANIKPLWQKHADQTYDALYEVARLSGTGVFDASMKPILEACLQMRKMTPDDLVKIILLSITSGSVKWEKQTPLKQ